MSNFFSFSIEGMPTLVEAPKRNLPPPPSSPKSTSGYVSKIYCKRKTFGKKIVINDNSK